MDNNLGNNNNININFYKMTKSEAETILKCYDVLERNTVNSKLINEAYSYLPNVSDMAFERVKIQAIRRFVMFNMDVIEEALSETQLIDIPDDTYDIMNSDKIIEDIENELYEDQTPEDMETNVINDQTGPKKKVGKTIGRPRATTPKTKTKIVKKK